MKTLEEIAANPQEASISENLLLVADPLGEYHRIHGELSEEKLAEIKIAIEANMESGRGYIETFRGLLMGVEGNARFSEVEIPNRLEELQQLLRHMPNELKGRLRSLPSKKKDGRKKSESQSPDLAELSRYYQQWEDYLTKRSVKSGPGKRRNFNANPFQSLEAISNHSKTMFIRDEYNKGYPGYSIFAWIERVKTKERIIGKMLQKIFESMEKHAENPEGFYESYFGADQFGVRIINFDEASRGRVEGIFTPYDGRNKFVLDSSRDFTTQPKGLEWNAKNGNEGRQEKDKGRILSASYHTKDPKRLRVLEYMLRGADQKVPVILQVQIATYPQILLDDFFSDIKHPLIEVRRIAQLDAYRRKYRGLYDKMKAAMERVFPT